MRTRQKFSISSYSTIKISNDVIECFNQLGLPVIYYDWYYTVVSVTLATYKKTSAHVVLIFFSFNLLSLA
ncbi:hypothetical protein BK411_22835 [Vibrio splendidus]|nr:hypothetical protein BK411_22835 [Vibrio splendidus]